MYVNIRHINWVKRNALYWWFHLQRWWAAQVVATRNKLCLYLGHHWKEVPTKAWANRRSRWRWTTKGYYCSRCGNVTARAFIVGETND